MKEILKRLRIPIVLIILLAGAAIVMASDATKTTPKDTNSNAVNIETIDNSAEHETIDNSAEHKETIDNSAEHSGSKVKQSYSAIFGCIDRDGKDISSGTGSTDISNCTINLPVTANVYVTASGSLDSNAVTRLRIRMDDWDPDWGYIVYDTGMAGFQISELYPKVKAGKHKISIRGESENKGRIDNLVISIIVDQKGNIKIKSTG